MKIRTLSSVLILCLSLSLPALADDTEGARAAFAAAQTLYQSSRFAEALKKFEAAQALKPHPVIIFNIARCHEQLGAVPQALKGYREYLRLSPQATDRDAVVASIASLEKRLPAATSQQLVVNAEPAACVVAIDGKRAGTAPISIELAPGEHTLEVSAEGYETLTRTVTLAPQRTVELNIALRARPAARVAAKAVVTDAPTRDPELVPPSPSEPALVTQPLEPPARIRTITWISGGTAVAAAATGLALGLAANGVVAELKSGDGSRPGAESGAIATQAQELATGANVAWGLAGAAAITAVIFFFVEGAAPPSP